MTSFWRHFDVICTKNTNYVIFKSHFLYRWHQSGLGIVLLKKTKPKAIMTSAAAILIFSKCSRVPRWHKLVSWCGRYKRKKNIKTFCIYRKTWFYKNMPQFYQTTRLSVLHEHLQKSLFLLSAQFKKQSMNKNIRKRLIQENTVCSSISCVFPDNVTNGFHAICRLQEFPDKCN